MSMLSQIVTKFIRSSQGKQVQNLSKNVKYCFSTASDSQYTQDNNKIISKFDYETLYKQSIEDPETFWDDIGKYADWFKPYEKVLDNSNPPFTKWYVGGQLNTCYNAVDRHVDAGHGDRIAIIHDSPITNSVTKISYSQLKDQAARLAGGMAKMGVKKGDRVLIYMPMVAEAIVAMMAITRLGAIHSLVFGGFASKELATRISHLEPKVIISASCGLEPSRTVKYKPMLDEAIELSTFKPYRTIILQRPNLPQAELKPNYDISWNDLIDTSQPHDPVPVDSNDPCYVLYTSGTTGTPKGIVRPTGGHAAVLPWTMESIYGMEKGDVWWAASDLGWIVGHSYICYSPLFHGNTTIVYEGKPVGTPDSGQFFRVIADHKVKGMFTAPTALRSISREDINVTEGRKYDISSLKYLFIAGEPLDHETKVWSESSFNAPALDNWWQTETGFAITAHAVGMGMPTATPRGSTGKPFVGYNLKVLTPEGNEAESGELGRIVCKLPLPPACMTTLYKAPERFLESYFVNYPGYYDTMDAGIKDHDNYIHIKSRDDDVINVAGHRLSTLALEEAVLEHPEVVDAAVIGVPDDLKGEVPLALCILGKECQKNEEQIQKEVVQVVRKLIGPVAALRTCILVPALPRTRSGKTARKSIADLAKNKSIKISPTIEDPYVYRDILNSLRRIGFANDVEDPLANM